MKVPRSGDVPCRKPAGLTALSKLIGTLVADCAVQGVAAHIRICTIGEERGGADMSVGHGVVVTVLLVALLEHVVVVVRSLTHSVLDTPRAEPSSMTLGAVDLGTAEKIDDVFFGECLAVIGCGTEIPTEQRVVSPLVDTAFRKNRNRQCVRVVRILVKERVVVPDGGGVHRAVSERLVGFVKDVVLL